MTPETAIAALTALSDPAKAAEALAYHKVDRPYLGVPAPRIDALAKEWRADLTTSKRIALCEALWASNIHEARIAAAKLLTQARIKPDDSGAWQLISAWVEDLDAWAIADTVCTAGQKRLIADPARLDEVEAWTTSENMWTRRAALVITLPWTKMNFPKPADLEIRDRVLGWMGVYATDHTWFIQKAIAWWLRELSKHDKDRVADFIEEHGDKMKSFARKEALRLLD
ncbi:DNA alkylation repair protein [Pseudogemmobacter sp. W21_MBD1_M6]|uniref:DNA alkylation repair protein n=1 Tax=Pseudogemmobacter sp. W21_MBD1_M6 TaxID=3240271 RepID=UPI003F991595